MTRSCQGVSDATRSHAATNIAGAKAAKGFRRLAISEIRTSRKCLSVLWVVSLYRTSPQAGTAPVIELLIRLALIFIGAVGAFWLLMLAFVAIGHAGHAIYQAVMRERILRSMTAEERRSYELEAIAASSGSITPASAELLRLWRSSLSRLPFCAVAELRASLFSQRQPPFRLRARRALVLLTEEAHRSPPR